MFTSDDVEAQRHKYLAWQKEYDVIDSFPDDQFDETKFDANCIWTELYGDDYSFIITGYEKYDSDSEMPVVGYFASKKPWTGEPGEFIEVLTSMLQSCPVCEGTGEDEDGDDCQECDGARGTYIDF